MEIPTYKNFRILDLTQVNIYKSNIGSQKNFNFILIQAEKILRYIEIRKAELNKREKQNGRSLSDSQLLFISIIEFFISIYEKNSDLRFINCCLKIRDLTWLKLNEVEKNVTTRMDIIDKRIDKIIDSII